MSKEIKKGDLVFYNDKKCIVTKVFNHDIGKFFDLKYINPVFEGVYFIEMSVEEKELFLN